MNLAARAGYNVFLDEFIITDGSTPQTEPVKRLVDLVLSDVSDIFKGRNKTIELCRRAGFDICVEESAAYVLDSGNRNITHLMENLMSEVISEIEGTI